MTRPADSLLRSKSGAPAPHEEREDFGAPVALSALIDRSRRLVVLTGAGVSTSSGIPDYRDRRGAWKRKPPMRLQEFVTSEGARKRYWARATAGWALVRDAEPSAAHRALAELERAGRLHHLITQNVDRLHQKAGATRVVDLHGRIDRVRCLSCGDVLSRDEHQARLQGTNPGFHAAAVGEAPDGDADLVGADYEAFRVPDCLACSGILKPDVVFFGESVPKKRVAEAMAQIDEADLLLVAGTSLMVWSGYRFVKRAHARAIPVVSVNLGVTRADDELALKLDADCGETLRKVADSILGRPPGVSATGGSSSIRAQSDS
jgi:NAD-dependent SIR2 family protein deacetylase